MATISMNLKEVEALYFLIGAQEAHLETSEDKEYNKIAYKSMQEAETLIRKYYKSKNKKKE